ncbi:hypothetical protein BS47DRAFT_1483867 [Hydnum rufescens UP504]|uniref:Uncharacterized protein n=1 Tax=Hydnum rufescens UP504 TaxID=1448309 RepID=A0A9P6B305_9AGAM|nr:hypothetical protein BS47DRAFT_1483867 [Hydnum rufescens UP504]
MPFSSGLQTLYRALPQSLPSTLLGFGRGRSASFQDLSSSSGRTLGKLAFSVVILFLYADEPLDRTAPFSHKILVLPWCPSFSEGFLQEICDRRDVGGLLSKRRLAELAK